MTTHSPYRRAVEAIGTGCLALDGYLGRTLGAQTAFTPAAGLSMFLVLTVGGILMLVRLGAAEVCGFNEAVEALVVQQMVEHGSVIFPFIGGHDPAYKPPLFHWAATAMAYLLGMHEASEFTVRLPAVLFALGGIAMTMAFMRRRMGAHAAALAGLVLIGSYQYVSEARVGCVDMALTFLETLTLFAFLSWDSRETSVRASWADRRRFLIAVAAGLAVLAKGPVGAVVPLTAICVALARERRWDVLRRLLAPGPIVVFLMVAGSWYAACLLGRHDTFLGRQLVNENLKRFAGGLGVMAPWYYLKPLLLNSMPLSLLAPIAVVAALRQPIAAREERSHETLPGREARLLAMFWLVTVVFFSIAAYKRRSYLLPLWPSVSILLVSWLCTLARDREGRILRGAVTATCGVLIVFNLLYIPSQEMHHCPGFRYRKAASQIESIVTQAQPLYSAVSGTVNEELMPLRFYLDRTIAPLRGSLKDAPSLSYVLVPHRAWSSESTDADGFHEILTVKLKQAWTLLQRNDAAVAR